MGVSTQVIGIAGIEYRVSKRSILDARDSKVMVFEWRVSERGSRDKGGTLNRLHSKCEGSTQRRQGLLKLAGYHQDLQPVGYVCWTLDECGKGDQQLPGLLYNEPIKASWHSQCHRD